MALTPHAGDPNRKKQLRDINKMVESGGEGLGLAKQNWNAEGKVKEQDAVPTEPENPSEPNPKGKGKGK